MEKDEEVKQSEQKQAHEEPVVYAIKKTVDGLQFSRRNFMEIATMTAAAAVLTGCGGDDELPPRAEPAPEVLPTDTDVPIDTAVPPTDTPVPTDTLVPPTDTSEPTHTLEPTATPSATPTPTPEVTVNQTSVNIRQGPSVAHPVTVIGHEGDTFPVTGRIQDGTWFEITLDDGSIGWIISSVLTFTFLVDTIPLATNIPTSPGSDPTETLTPAVKQTPESTFVDSQEPIAPGQTFAEISVGGQSYKLSCGSPIPTGAICICNCVSSIPPDSPICTCDSVAYWYPN